MGRTSAAQLARHLSPRRRNQHRLRKLVELRVTWETATATTTTTMKGVRTKAVTAAPKAWKVAKSKRRTASSVRASTQPTREDAALSITRETATAMMRTTTQGVLSMAVTVAPRVWPVV